MLRRYHRKPPSFFFKRKTHQTTFNLQNESIFFNKKRKIKTTFNGGSLGSRIDEERSELRYVV